MDSRKVELSEVITDIAAGPFGSNLKVACFVPEGFPIIDGANLKGLKITDNLTKFVTEEKARSLSRSIARRGEMVVTISGTLGQIAYIPENSAFPEYLCSQRQFRVAFDTDKVYVPFLVYYFHTRNGRSKILAFANQTGVPALSQPTKNFKRIVIDLPDIVTQKRIAKCAELMTSKIELNSRINDYLAEYLKSYAKRLYREYERDEGADLPEGWRRTTIGEISEMVCRGITPKYNDESDELILGQTCIRDNLVLLENGRLHAPKKITEKWLKKYDLLINSTGVGSLGRTAQVWFDPSKLVVDSHVTIVRAADPRHALYMGFWVFEHERYIESLHTGSTGQTELPRDHVKAIRLVLPSDVELEKFNAVAQPVVELIVANQEESKRLAELRDTLLPKLMSGEIDVSSVAI